MTTMMMFATATSGVDIQVFTGTVLLVITTLMVMLIALLAAGSKAAHRAALDEFANGSDKDGRDTNDE